ncbi:MAG: hypothetical protein NC902_04790, partial [Candidatus Omnitrophica bacterium]|nr:hypothetical protein [Candidatus Omnitrophota bacterium]
ARGLVRLADPSRSGRRGRQIPYFSPLFLKEGRGEIFSKFCHIPFGERKVEEVGKTAMFVLLPII